MDVYATAADLVANLAPGSTTVTERAAAAVYLGSRYVDRRLGNPVAEDHVLPPYADAITEVACPPSWRSAALAAAAFYYKLPDAPMGYLGGLAEYAVRVRTDVIPTADAALYGQMPGNWLVA